ncbi:hypothetical protein L1987_61105 [Smallanthus sonchifolius]|uniref:Uncharacterized protein n=1 Tax=Smallanthus sonchifolius TaxID=185202 RepID=A0ACB9DAT1_9ASTR|nr:hypothetical protein L1987_61105 [Smallanthus sonchifolius]
MKVKIFQELVFVRFRVFSSSCVSVVAGGGGIGAAIAGLKVRHERKMGGGDAGDEGGFDDGYGVGFVFRGFIIRVTEGGSDR